MIAPMNRNPMKSISNMCSDSVGAIVVGRAAPFDPCPRRAGRGLVDPQVL